MHTWPESANRSQGSVVPVRVATLLVLVLVPAAADDDWDWDQCRMGSRPPSASDRRYRR